MNAGEDVEGAWRAFHSDRELYRFLATIIGCITCGYNRCVATLPLPAALHAGAGP